jgi:hypothetical protein
MNMKSFWIGALAAVVLAEALFLYNWQLEKRAIKPPPVVVVDDFVPLTPPKPAPRRITLNPTPKPTPKPEQKQEQKHTGFEPPVLLNPPEGFKQFTKSTSEPLSELP